MIRVKDDAINVLVLNPVVLRASSVEGVVSEQRVAVDVLGPQPALTVELAHAAKNTIRRSKRVQAGECPLMCKGLSQRTRLSQRTQPKR